MWRSLGKVTVTTAGTPVRATANESTPSASYPAQSVSFQQVQSNTGKIWILDRSNGVTATGVGVLHTLAAPTLTSGVATTLPSVTVSIPSAPGGLNVTDLWIDADTSGEFCQVSAVR
jgi:hypothetical protein